MPPRLPQDRARDLPAGHRRRVRQNRAGFFGDEPDYSIGGSPWTPKLLERVFRRRKAYDLKPYLTQFFAGKLSDEAQRAKADYWDVWSGIFRNKLFSERKPSGAAKYNVEYLGTPDHEETMTALVRSEGRLLRDEPIRAGSRDSIT